MAAMDPGPLFRSYLPSLLGNLSPQARLGLLAISTLLLAKILSTLFFGSRSSKKHPPYIRALPLIGGIRKFLSGPIKMIEEEYPRLGGVFTVPLLTRRITFLIGPEESSHFFKAPEAEMSQQEVYQFNVPTFGPGVVFDVDYSVRMEQFRFFSEALRVASLKNYVEHMVFEAEVCNAYSLNSFVEFIRFVPLYACTLHRVWFILL